MEFGNVKTGLDVSMVILSTVVSLLALHRLVGVREGTVVAAVCVGQCCRLWRRSPTGWWVWNDSFGKRTAKAVLFLCTCIGVRINLKCWFLPV